MATLKHTMKLAREDNLNDAITNSIALNIHHYLTINTHVDRIVSDHIIITISYDYYGEYY